MCYYHILYGYGVLYQAKWNEMNRAVGHLCAHIGLTGRGEPPEDGEMIEMTLSSRHRIRNSSPGGLRPQHATSRPWMLPTILNFTRGWGRNIFWATLSSLLVGLLYGCMCQLLRIDFYFFRYELLKLGTLVNHNRWFPQRAITCRPSIRRVQRHDSLSMQSPWQPNQGIYQVNRHFEDDQGCSSVYPGM